VRARIVGTTVAVAAIAVLVLAIPLALAVSALYNDETAQELFADAANAAASVPAPLVPGDVVEIPATSSGAAIAVYAADGTRVAGTGPPRADPVTLAALQGKPSAAKVNGEVSVALPVGAQEHLVGAVRAALPQSAVDDRIRGTWLVMTGVGAGAILVAGLLAVWQARRLSRPLDRLALTAGRLGEGDFAAPGAPSKVKEIDTVMEVMQRTSERLAGVLERERAFSTDASHQLKTPLTALRIRLEGALLRPVDDRDAEIRGAVEEIDRLQASVDDLLRLARDVPGDRRSLDVSGLITASAVPWRSRLGDAGRRLQVQVPDALSRITISESALRQILDILVDNASTHGRGTVTISARELEGGMIIDVADEGDGVGEPQRIFERRRSGGGGTGIGLALARSLAQAEQGRLTLLARGPHPVFRLALVVDSDQA
jgi:signal transduction histidine kinase